MSVVPRSTNHKAFNSSGEADLDRVETGDGFDEKE